MTTVEITSARPVGEVLAWSRAVIDPALRAAVETLPASMRHLTGYHLGWWDERGAPTSSAGGKAIRPTLVLLAAEAAGGTPEEAVPAAAAVELVHNFSLLHDDVMDGDATRRGRPTVWAVFGPTEAILAGDALLALAVDVLAASGHPTAPEGIRMLSAAVLDLVDGQHEDVAFEALAQVDVAECLGMATKKTGALLGCAAALGATVAGARPDQLAHLRGFGERLGVAFQHVDDLLGIWGDPVVTGKPAYADLSRRKKSLPVVAALASGGAAGAELAALYHRERPLSAADLAHAADLVQWAGGRTWSQTQAADLLAEALGHLDAAGLAARAGVELGALAHLVTHRDH
ncbi:MAG: polyprenyl synthetase family protein [Actinomycetota bacterium]|nr:polyprenyl synthetase family protein [Actinomycetota bacterium]